MNRSKSVRFVGALVVCLTSVAATGMWGPKDQQSAETARTSNTQPQIENKTQSLQVISTTNEAGLSKDIRILKITVMNVSNRNVVDYAFVKNDGSTVTTSGATTGWVLAPGQTDTAVIPVESAEQARATLFAALLEDGTGEGDIQEVRRMKDYRSGVAKQFLRAVPLLRQTKRTLTSDRALADLDNLHARLLALPEEPAGGDVPVGMASGVQHAKQFILRQVKASKDKFKTSRNVQPQVVEASIDEILAHVEKTLAKM
jgi:hypothetical protein